MYRALTNLMRDMKIIKKGETFEHENGSYVVRGLAELVTSDPTDDTLDDPGVAEMVVDEDDLHDSFKVKGNDEEHEPETAHEDVQPVEDEDEDEDAEEVADDTQRPTAVYRTGGWYELEDGSKVRRKGLPANCKVIKE